MTGARLASARTHIAQLGRPMPVPRGDRPTPGRVATSSTVEEKTAAAAMLARRDSLDLAAMLGLDEVLA